MRNRNHTRLLIALTLVACFTLVGFAANGASEHPMTLADILAWKRIQTPVITADGAFFAYRLTPAEGNAEVIVRNLKTGKEDRLSGLRRQNFGRLLARGGNAL